MQQYTREPTQPRGCSCVVESIGVHLLQLDETEKAGAVTDLIRQVSQLLRAELEELVDVAQATMEPIEPCDEVVSACSDHTGGRINPARWH